MRRIARKHRDRLKGGVDRFLEAHGAKALVVLLALVILVPLGITWRYLTTTADVANEAQQASREVRALQRETTASLIDSCKRNGNSVRKVLREEQRASLTSPDDPRLRALLPNVSRSVITTVIEEANAEHRERLRRLHPEPCEAQYPTP